MTRWALATFRVDWRCLTSCKHCAKIYEELPAELNSDLGCVAGDKTVKGASGREKVPCMHRAPIEELHSGDVAEETFQEVTMTGRVG